jgi:hypothetical protein
MGLRIIDRAKNHLVENNMTYREHLKFAVSHVFQSTQEGC